MVRARLLPKAPLEIFNGDLAPINFAYRQTSTEFLSDVFLD